jgi:hypothetical protein
MNRQDRLHWSRMTQRRHEQSTCSAQAVSRTAMPTRAVARRAVVSRFAEIGYKDRRARYRREQVALWRHGGDTQFNRVEIVIIITRIHQYYQYINGAPEEIRTPDPQIRSLMLFNVNRPLSIQSRSEGRRHSATASSEPRTTISAKLRCCRHHFAPQAAEFANPKIPHCFSMVTLSVGKLANSLIPKTFHLSVGSAMLEILI